MDLQSEKLDLIKWLTGLEDPDIITQVRNVQKLQQKESKELSESEKEAIEIGLQSIKQGKTHSHHSVLEETESKYPNLFE